MHTVRILSMNPETPTISIECRAPRRGDLCWFRSIDGADADKLGVYVCKSSFVFRVENPRTGVQHPLARTEFFVLGVIANPDDVLRWHQADAAPLATVIPFPKPVTR